jgi:hypothetical protein
MFFYKLLAGFSIVLKYRYLPILVCDRRLIFGLNFIYLLQLSLYLSLQLFYLYLSLLTYVPNFLNLLVPVPLKIPPSQSECAQSRLHCSYLFLVIFPSFLTFLNLYLHIRFLSPHFKNLLV